MKQMTTVVQVLVAAMIMLNGLLLMMTRQEYWPSVLLIVMPIIQCIIVDKKKWYQLPSWASNTIGFGIGAYAVFYFINNPPDRHLAIISDLVTYLIITLLFQAKSPRLYWQISILSVLQAVVASVFSLNLQQGMLFVTYICIVVTGLSTIVYNRDQLMSAGRLDEMQNITKPGLGLRILRSDGSLRALAHRQTLSRRSFRNLLTAISLLALLSVASGMAVYISMPTSDQQQGMGTLRLKRTGVNWQINNLEPDGVLRKDMTEALRLRILDPISNLPKRLVGDVYLRGSVLEVLDQKKTGWHPYSIRGRRYPLIENPSYRGRVYTQEIILNPSEDPMLFLAHPASPIGELPEDVIFDLYSETLFRNPEHGIILRSPFRYQAGLYGLRNDSVPETTPFLNYQTFNFSSPLSADFASRYQRLTQMDTSKYPSITAKAKEIAKDIKGRDRIATARALSDYLAYSGRFSYTTNFRDIERDQSLDPVEDFFANYRRGHCELYASTLALMCRSQNIPARVVVGFRVSRYNEVAGHYQVLQKHAHSWVEVYLTPRDCSDRMLADGQASKGGAWLRLDPTPPASVVEELDSSLIAQANDALGYAQSLWDDYVLGMRPQENSRSSTTWINFWLRLRNIFDLTTIGSNLQNAIQSMNAWQRAGLAAILAMAIAWWNYARAKKQNKRKRRHKGKQPAKSWRRFIPFSGKRNDKDWDVTVWADDLWLRLESLLTKHGIERRKPSQTPKEYVNGINKRFADADQQLASDLTNFTEQFYLIRYGETGDQSLSAKVETSFHQVKSAFELYLKKQTETKS